MSGALLTKAEIRAIGGRVRALSDRRRPTWTMVEEVAEAVAGRRFSRQSLSAHKAIKKSYDDRVQAYQKANRTGRPEDPDKIEDAAARRHRLVKEENEELRIRLAEYDRRLQVMAEQVQLRGIDMRNLAATLSPMHREGR